MGSSSLVRGAVRAVWPGGRAVRVRRRVVDAYNAMYYGVARLYSSLDRRTVGKRFLVWSQYSRWRFGETRWITIYDSYRILVRTDDFRAFRVAETHGTQRDKVAAWNAMARLGPEVCVDAGANYGEFSSTVADLVPQVICVEANPLLVSCLEQTFAGAENVAVVHAAASDVEGVLPFFCSITASGASSLAEAVPRQAGGALKMAKRVEKISVPARRLDKLIPEVLGRTPASFLLKADVEGFEGPVIDGLELLRQRVVWWRALLEFNPDAIQKSGFDAADLWNRLRKFPGLVIAEFHRGIEGVSAGEGGDGSGPFLYELNHSLRKAVPDEQCEIIIGEGVARTAGGGGKQV